MKDLTFNLTQFILIIILNVVVLGYWYISTPVKTVTKVEIKTNTVYKTKTEVRNDQATFYTNIIQKARETCSHTDDYNSPNGIEEFHLDANNRPVFKCHY